METNVYLRSDETPFLESSSDQQSVAGARAFNGIDELEWETLCAINAWQGQYENDDSDDDIDPHR